MHPIAQYQLFDDTLSEFSTEVINEIRENKMFLSQLNICLHLFSQAAAHFNCFCFQLISTTYPLLLDLFFIHVSMNFSLKLIFFCLFWITVSTLYPLFSAHYFNNL